MKHLFLLTFYSILMLSVNTSDIMAGKIIEKDTIMTSAGPAEIWFLGHGSLMIKFEGRVIQVDPYSAVADYSVLPDADLILITHQHADHLDAKAIEEIKKNDTEIVCNVKSGPMLPGSKIMSNGDKIMSGDIMIEAVPAYNIKHKRSPGNPYHPKGEGNGYVLTMGGKKIYIAGDTENIPEMRRLKDIYVAFLPMNVPYTMTPEMVADAVRMFNPAIIYPYHYSGTDPELLIPLVDSKITEVRIRDLK